MTPPPLPYPDCVLIVPPVYAGTVPLYAAMAQYGAVCLDPSTPWDKRRKESHRTVIAGANGIQRLTVPIVKPDRYHGTTVGDIKVSDHGHWWDLHRGAIESAYGRTPYYEYYADEIAPAFTGHIDSLYNLDLLLHRFACRVAGINDISGDTRAISHYRPVLLADHATTATEHPYWQVWADRYGFQPGLSVLDLIFSLGPLTTLHLRK